MTQRIYDSTIIEKLKSNKIIVVKGPKSSQKSNYLANLIDTFSTVTQVNCEDKKVKNIFKTMDVKSLRELFGKERFVVLKEAQSVEQLQALIELILFENQFANSFVLSCSFDPILAEGLIEALKANDAIVTIYPPMFQELANKIGIVQFDKELDKRLIYGNFPQILQSENPETELNAIIDKTIFTSLNPSERINKGDKLRKMLQYISFELGEPLSYNAIGEYAGLDNETVERYVNLLERSFVLIRIPSFYQGNKYELKKTHTFYFLDNGVRNALIKNFNNLDLRVDIDKLWKNWLIAERIKWNSYLNTNVRYYFWRTHTRQHIDFMEVSETQITAFKSLWDKRKKPKFPASFTEYYPNVSLHALNRSTYWAFLTKKK